MNCACWEWKASNFSISFSHSVFCKHLIVSVHFIPKLFGVVCIVSGLLDLLQQCGRRSSKWDWRVQVSVCVGPLELPGEGSSALHPQWTQKRWELWPLRMPLLCLLHFQVSENTNFNRKKITRMCVMYLVCLVTQSPSVSITDTTLKTNTTISFKAEKSISQCWCAWKHCILESIKPGLLIGI